jgi:hypothetical protein
MSNISVALTTTKFMIGREDSSTDMNVPICIAELGMGIFGGNTEQMEHLFAEVCRKNAKIVDIHPDKKTIFIGMDPSIEETGLITYTEERNSEYSIEFFKRWSELHCMIFEFQMLDLKNEPLFALQGIWRNDHWEKLDVKPRGSMHVI